MEQPTPSLTLSQKFFKRLKRYFFAGILVTAPIGITVYIAWSVVDFVDRKITPLLPIRDYPDFFPGWNIPGFGLIVLLVGLTLIGAITANIFGRVLVRIGEKILEKTPVVRGLYGLLKQMTEMLVGGNTKAFRQVVLVPFPSESCLSVGFLTAQAPKELGGDLLGIFVPTTPNPTSGFLVYFPKDKIKYLPLSVDEGFKLIVSSGIALPKAYPELRR